MIQPPFLKPGDKIAIVAPARSITFEEVHPSLKLLARWGLEPVLGTHIFDKCHQFAGKDESRLFDLQQMLDDESIRAVLCARGGYGTVRIVDRLDFSRFMKHPKWIVGYSDITVLHTHIQEHFGIETLHATMPYNIKESGFQSFTAESLRKALFGEKIFYRKRMTFPDRTGLSEGILAGGNLSILYSLMGTVSEPGTEGKILLLEDVDEYLYHIDRMMMSLKRAGKLRELKGLIVGSMKDMKDNAVPFGRTAQEIIADAVREYAYPVCFDFPSGHDSDNAALYLGRMVRLEVRDEAFLEYI